MEPEIRLREANRADLTRILDLVSLSLGTGSIPRDPDYWGWKHEKSPFGPSPVLLAEANGQIVGLRVFMRWEWIEGETRLASVRAVDTATHPDWQGRGIFTRLTQSLAARMKQEGISFIFNTPNRNSRPGYLKMGWASMGRPGLWIRPVRPLRCARLLWLLRSERGTPTRSMPVPLDEKHDLRRLLERPELEKLLEIHGHDSNRIRTNITAKYLQWRYSESPGISYFGAGAWKTGSEALMIFRICDRAGMRELRVCDILLGSGRNSEKSTRDLMREVVSITSPDFVVAMALSGATERKVLLKCGFLYFPKTGPIMTIRPLASASDDLSGWSKWRLSIGDLELF